MIIQNNHLHILTITSLSLCPPKLVLNVHRVELLTVVDSLTPQTGSLPACHSLLWCHCSTITSVHTKLKFKTFRMFIFRIYRFDCFYFYLIVYKLVFDSWNIISPCLNPVTTGPVSCDSYWLVYILHYEIFLTEYLEYFLPKWNIFTGT